MTGPEGPAPGPVGDKASRFLPWLLVLGSVAFEIYASGVGTGVTLSVTGGTFDGATHVTASGSPAPATDADTHFAGKLSALGSVSYQNLASPTGDLVLTFTGMNVSQSHELVFYGHRDSYSWDRASVVTLSGADAFTNESSVAVDNPEPFDFCKASSAS